MNITVIVTHRNHHRYLADAIDSVLTQTLLPFEIIVIDDGSTERPKLNWLVEQYRHASVVMTPPRGIGAALNAAISVMRGDVFCWLPADDLWHSDKLERQAKFAAEYPDCVLHSYADVWSDDLFNYIGIVPDLTDEEFAAEICTSSPYFGNTFWIPKGILDAVGPFREDVPASEDYQWVLRSVVRHGVRYRLQKEALTVKRHHANTTTERHRHDIPRLMREFNRELCE